MYRINYVLNNQKEKDLFDTMLSIDNTIFDKQSENNIYYLDIDDIADKNTF